VLLGLAAPASSRAATPGQDSVVGSLLVGPPALTYDIDAFSGPSGEQPGGTVTHTRFFPLELSVTCLQATGSRAVIGSRLEAGGSVLIIYLVVVDAPGGEQDRLSDLVYLNEPAPATCAEAGALVADPRPATSGSVVVTDAPALPTTKEQCKDGGYARFGFRNQGQCVKFVVSPP